MEPDLLKPKEPYTVTSLTNEIKSLLQDSFGWAQVRGEISNYKKAPSGHAYFSLKDDNALLSCVAWRNTVIRWSGLSLKDGDEVIAGGTIDVYPPRGQYQFVVDSIRLAGIGALQQRFEELKQRLMREGIFDSDRKKELPRFPRRIAVITSPTGAAIRDFLRIIHQNQCPVEITVCPTLVQGNEAAADIAAMIQRVNAHRQHDLIVPCRGGGSLEDLWAFNEESVARAIFESAIPVLTGIGHEIDFTIADFAADERAPTPTAAAQRICDIFNEHRGRVLLLQQHLFRSAGHSLKREKERLEVTRKALGRYHPLSVTAMKRQRLDDFYSFLTQAIQARLRAGRLEHKRASDNLVRGARRHLELFKRDLLKLNRLLQSYNIQNILNRGFSVCKTTDGGILKDSSSAAVGDRLSIRLAKGSLEADVRKVHKDHSE